MCGFDRDASGVTDVLTQHQRLSCAAVVLAAGVWSGPPSKKLGATLPIHPGKGYRLDYTPAPVPLRTSVTLTDAHFAVTPLDGMVRLAGTMEFSGFNDRVNRSRVEAIKQAAHVAFKDGDPTAPHRRAWAGMRPMTPDGRPIIGALQWSVG